MNASLPRWADLLLLPLVSLMVALAVAGGVVALVGQDPLLVIEVLIQGAFGTARGLSYTLYYATTFVLTGLAVAVAFHGGLFNIGGEGQAVMGGLGTGLVAIWWSAFLPAWLMLPLMISAVISKVSLVKNFGLHMQTAIPVRKMLRTHMRRSVPQVYIVHRWKWQNI